jgi:DNA replication protein DnaC
MNMNEMQPASMTILVDYEVIKNIDQKKCITHNTVYEFRKYKFTSQIIEHCSFCAEDYKLQEEKRRKQEKEALEFFRLTHGIPQKFISARLTDFENILPILNWLEEPKGFLFIHGPCGSGKSHLAAAIKYFFNTNRFEARLVFSSDMFLELRKTFNNKKGESESEFSVIEKYAPTEQRGIKLCIFDDIGAQKISEYAIEAWYDIIDRRYRNDNPTIFTSNLSLKEISICMTDRIASRLASGNIFELTGRDRRIKRNMGA